MASVSIQIIEGNPHLRSHLSWRLQQLNYDVCTTPTLQQARDMLIQARPSVVILDADLAEGNALEFCQWIQQTQSALVLMLSARSEEQDVVRGLDAGADDYLTKPFGERVLFARLQALIRRCKSQVAPAYLDYGILRIDLIQRRVWLRNRSIELTPQEFSLLYALAQSGGKPLSRTEILSRAWPDSIDNPRTVDTHILSLRKKIEVEPRQPNTIQTVRNVGYRLNVDALEEGVPVRSLSVAS
ncbi:MAG: response regulator transcription factor [Cyanobacteria bacterium P01_D01_bin.73]